MGWKIFFWGYLLVVLSSIGFCVLQTEAVFEPGFWILLFASIVSTIGLYSYAYNKRIGSQKIWLAILLASLGYALVNSALTIEYLGNIITNPLLPLFFFALFVQDVQTIGLINVLFIPTYYAMYKLAMNNASVDTCLSPEFPQNISLPRGYLYWVINIICYLVLYSVTGIFKIIVSSLAMVGAFTFTSQVSMWQIMALYLTFALAPFVIFYFGFYVYRFLLGLFFNQDTDLITFKSQFLAGTIIAGAVNFLLSSTYWYYAPLALVF